MSEQLVSDYGINIVISQWQDMDIPDIYKISLRDIAIDLKNERRRNKELETQLELMTHHRNRVLDKREGHR